MELRITIDMDNEAFGEDEITMGVEVGRILRILKRYAEELHGGGTIAGRLNQNLMDVNGNKVGKAMVVRVGKYFSGGRVKEYG